MLKKLIEKIFGKRCACNVKTVCGHLNTETNKLWVEYCSDCKKIIKEI